MSTSDVRVGVSVQVTGFEDRPWLGHLTSGWLLKPDRVILPEPPECIVDGTIDFEVLILPLPLDGGQRIEWIRPAKVVVIDVTDAAKKVVALDLVFASRAEPDDRLCGLPADEVNAAIKDHPDDLWAAFAAMGAIPDEQGDVITPDLLRQAAEVAVGQQRPVYELSPLDGAVPPDGCPATPICKK